MRNPSGCAFDRHDCYSEDIAGILEGAGAIAQGIKTKAAPSQSDSISEIVQGAGAIANSFGKNGTKQSNSSEMDGIGAIVQGAGGTAKSFRKTVPKTKNSSSESSGFPFYGLFDFLKRKK